jgi:hypothetical protein
VFLLTKRERYYYDNEAVREDSISIGGGGFSEKYAEAQPNHGAMKLSRGDYSKGRNRRTVWTIATEPTSEAHFATYPRKLVEPCIKAGASERGCCPVCGAPWVRVVETTHENYRPTRYAVEAAGGALSGGVDKNFPDTRRTTTGWKPTCDHDEQPRPAIVFDPFNGSGTTGIVSRALGRNYIGCDLSLPYLQDIARKRMSMDAMDEWQNGAKVDAGGYGDLPMFAEAA